MNTYTLYQLKFVRYLISAAGICLFTIFGALYLDSIQVIDLNAGGGVLFLVLSVGSLFVGIITAAKISIYTFHISADKEGLDIKINPPLGIFNARTKSIPWQEIEAFNTENYSNGTTLNFITTSGEMYRFSNTIFRKSADMQAFAAALQKGADAFDMESGVVHRSIGRLPGFYAGTFALVVALFLVILMILIPILMFFTDEGWKSTTIYIKMGWFYTISIVIIRKVYMARKK